MEQNAKLGPCARSLRLTAGAVLLCTIALGCSLPRITVTEDPLTAEEHLQLAISYEENKEWQEAAKQYRSAAKDIPEAHLYLGNLYFQQEDWEQAEKQYRKAIRKLPDNPRPLNNLAWLKLTRREDLEKAQELARRAVELAPPGDKIPYLDTLQAIQKALAAADATSP